MFSGDYPRNCWYVAGRSEDFGRDLKPLRLFDEEIVFYRKAEGTPVALEDACPHRKLPLSKGKIEGDRVVCGYHGLTFDGAGACVAAPTQEGAIPKRARVKSYPLIEKYGFVWIWPGDPERADAGKLIDIPNYDDPSWGQTRRGALDIACNYLWITDNLLDPSHVAWVHLTSFAGAGTDNVALEITEERRPRHRLALDPGQTGSPLLSAIPGIRRQLRPQAALRMPDALHRDQQVDLYARRDRGR